MHPLPWIHYRLNFHFPYCSVIEMNKCFLETSSLSQLGPVGARSVAGAFSLIETFSALIQHKVGVITEYCSNPDVTYT